MLPGHQVDRRGRLNYFVSKMKKKRTIAMIAQTEIWEFLALDLYLREVRAAVGEDGLQ